MYLTQTMPDTGRTAMLSMSFCHYDISSGNFCRRKISNHGTTYDNVIAESFLSIMKKEELFYNWYHTAEEQEKTVSDFTDFSKITRI